MLGEMLSNKNNLNEAIFYYKAAIKIYSEKKNSQDWLRAWKVQDK